MQRPASIVRRTDRRDRTGVHAGAAGSAAVAHERRVRLQFGRRNHLAQQQERAEPGIRQQRIASDPAQAGLDRPRLFGQRSGIGKNPSGRPGHEFPQVCRQFVQPFADRQMVIPRMRIGSDPGCHLVRRRRAVVADPGKRSPNGRLRRAPPDRTVCRYSGANTPSRRRIRRRANS